MPSSTATPRTTVATMVEAGSRPKSHQPSRPTTTTTGTSVGTIARSDAGIDPQASIITTKKGKVKDRSWDAAKKQMLSNVAGFLNQLLDFKAVVDAFTVPKVNWREIRPYLEMEHFTPEVIEKKNKAAAGLVSWVINIVLYYDTIVGVEPKRKALAEANARLEAANTKLSQVQARVC